MKKRIATITALFMLLAIPAFAAPGIPHLTAAGATVASQDNPLVIAFNGYQGYTYLIDVECDYGYAGIVYSFRTDGSLINVGTFTDAQTLHVNNSSTYIIVVAPRWGEAMITAIVAR